MKQTQLAKPKQKNMKKYLIIYLFLNSLFINSQITDSIKMPFQVKFNLHQTLKEGEMRDSQGKNINFLSYIKKNIKYRDKPTLLLCWATYDLYGKKMIDQLLNKALYEKYNFVFINRNKQDQDAKFIEKTNKQFPFYSQHFISLFDFQNIFGFNDNRVTPMLFWLDKDFKLVTSTIPVNGITSDQVENVFWLVESKKIVSSKIKFFKSDLLPCSEDEAELKLIFSETGNSANLKLVVIKTEQSYYDLNFIKNNKGNYFYVKTQNEIKRETSKKETINTIREILGSLKGVKFRSFLGGSITEYEFKESSINYKVQSGDFERSYKYSFIYWDKLVNTDFKKDNDLTLITLNFSNALVIEIQSSETNQSYENEISIPIPEDKKEILKKAFLLLSQSAKKGN
jgi:hypothetical protein